MTKARRAPRTSFVFGAEPLEARSLLSVGGPLGLVSAPWGVDDAVNPSSAVIVKFHAGTPDLQTAADLSAVGGRVVKLDPGGTTLVALAPWADRAVALGRLNTSADVAYAEADAPLRATGYVVPNNPKYSQEWGMALVDAPQAWTITTGTPAVIVAVLDTGIDTRNPAFAGRIWTNPDPYSGKLGYVGDVHGWNFISGTANIQDDDGHGTHVAGILGATGNNGIGTAGLNWGVRIMPLKVLDQQGNGDTSAAVSAVYYAVQHGAKVINASWGGDVFSQSMLDALNYARNAGVVFVTAAGNDSLNNDQTTTYPASFRTGNELVVAALDQSGNLADYSNYGPSTVDLAAPGTNVLSTVLNNKYQTISGTSMATPFVSGTVALLAGVHPGLTAEQLVGVVRATAKPIPSLAGKLISPGVVDPYYALTNHVSANSAAAAATVAPPLAVGASSLTDVEAAILSSDGFGPSGDAAGYVSLAYRALVGRSPAAADITYFASAFQGGLTRPDFVKALQSGLEARRTRAARLFQDALGSSRSLDDLKSDPAVIAVTNLLAAGWSDADVLTNVLASDSYGRGAGGGTDAGFLAAVYNGVLARAVDPYGLSVFTNALATGLPRGAIVRGLLANPEGRQTGVARLFRDEFQWTDSLDVLKGNPGVVYWSNFLASA